MSIHCRLSDRWMCTYQRKRERERERESGGEDERKGDNNGVRKEGEREERGPRGRGEWAKRESGGREICGERRG